MELQEFTKNYQEFYRGYTPDTASYQRYEENLKKIGQLQPQNIVSKVEQSTNNINNNKSVSKNNSPNPSVQANK